MLCFTSLTVFSEASNAFRFKITGNGYSDETVVRLHEEASVNFDGMYDAWKLFSSNVNVPSIYTLTSGGDELSINSLPEFIEDVSITIYTIIPASGTYTLNVEEVFDLTEDYKISLTDLSSGNHYRLLGDTVLTFNLDSQENAPTFTFNISTNVDVSTTNETCYGYADGTLMVDNKGNSEWDIEVTKGYDNIIVKDTITSNLYLNNDLASGDYFCKITSMGIVDTFRFTIESSEHVTSDFSIDQDSVYINDILGISNTSINAESYLWDFGDGNGSSDFSPIHHYENEGNYQISLEVSKGTCISRKEINVIVLEDENTITSIDNIGRVETNILSLGRKEFKIVSQDQGNKSVFIHDIKGNVIYSTHYNENQHIFSLKDYSSGIYIVSVNSSSNNSVNSGKNFSIKKKIFISN